MKRASRRASLARRGFQVVLGSIGRVFLYTLGSSGLTERPDAIVEDDFAELHDHGFSRRAIWDIGSVTAFFNRSNRMAQIADMRPNEGFYRLGRDQDDE